MNNPQAFPRPFSQQFQDEKYRAQEGMTLRDYFAAKAMQPIMSAEVDAAECAAMAYAMADAMLEARSKTNEQ